MLSDGNGLDGGMLNDGWRLDSTRLNRDRNRIGSERLDRDRFRDSRWLTDSYRLKNGDRLRNRNRLRINYRLGGSDRLRGSDSYALKRPFGNQSLYQNFSTLRYDRYSIVTAPRLRRRLYMVSAAWPSRLSWRISHRTTVHLFQRDHRGAVTTDYRDAVATNST